MKFLDISILIKEAGVKIILLAIPSIGKSHRKKILNQLSKFPVKVMELPSVENIIDGKVTVNDIKKVDVEDILGRALIEPINELLSKNIANKNCESSVAFLLTEDKTSVGQD